MIITIDGPAASGKSITAKGAAERLGFLYLDTGAMYRAVTLAFLRAGVKFDDIKAIESILDELKLSLVADESGSRILIGDEDVSEAIRGLNVTQNVSAVSAVSVVRKKMVQLQREVVIGKNAVVEGRDIGTVVFPDADFKFFISANVETRAKRRQKDLEKLGIKQSVDEIVEDLKQRDRKDSSRRLSPLKKSDDARVIDTTSLTINDQINIIVNQVRLKIGKEEKNK
ncbi:MAG: (d)CMP kinase [Candidatus Marinimicrobia bacterium]|nr:(d)CMP kinase [Candidatus Neomarinimicrobiota bacterium]